MSKAGIISFCGKVPLLGSSLRKIARRYPEGSVVTIGAGSLAGARWKRSHRYVSGYWLGQYELSIQECLVRELRPGDVFYDVGANAGFFTLLGSRCVGPAGKVFSFEPLPENARSIQSQLDLNGVENCTLVEAAVTDHTGHVEFAEGRDTSTAHIRGATTQESRGAATSVSAVSLDDFVREAPEPDFIKMDIEGAELMALKGACELLGSEKPPKMMIEFHGEHLIEQGCAMLKEFGYTFWSLTGKAFETCQDERHVLCLPYEPSG